MKVIIKLTIALIIITLSATSLGKFQVSITASPETETPQIHVANDLYLDKQWAFEKVPALPVASDSPEILIAILDTGIDETHKDLAGRVAASINFSNSKTTSDVNGHGTHVAGIIAAASNSTGIAGIAPHVRLLNVKVAEDNGIVWESAVAKGIVWAVDNGAKIINMSLFVPTPSPALEQAIDYAWGKGAILIASAGNCIKGVPVYPAYYHRVIAVAAIDSEGNLWANSNYGDWVDVYAPGVEIYSTLPDNNYGYLSGTSMATAYASAIAALALVTTTDTNDNGFVNDEVTTLLKTLLATPK